MSSQVRPKILIIAGPTASGKTDLAIEVAHDYNGEIINCDSRQIYRKLDIGTAKPIISTRNDDDDTVMVKGVRHHLLDYAEPAKEYTLVDFQRDAKKAIKTIIRAGKLPILTGGTGLYIDAVVFNYDLKEEEQNKKARMALQKLSVDELQEILAREDPGSYDTLNESDRSNPHRLIRAIERARNESGPRSDGKKESSPYLYLYLILNTSIKELNSRISERTALMFENGLADENRRLREEGYSTDMPALKAIGYQEFDDYFKEEQTLEETKELIEVHTRQYARRQRTWFRHHKDAKWIDNKDEAEKEIEQFLSD